MYILIRGFGLVYFNPLEIHQRNYPSWQWERISNVHHTNPSSILNQVRVANSQVTISNLIFQATWFEFYDFYTGTFSFLRLANVTNFSLEAICARLETGCSAWSNCHSVAKESKKGFFNKEDKGGDASRFNVRMLRVMKGELYVDWPWGAYRYSKDVYTTGTSKGFALWNYLWF